MNIDQINSLTGREFEELIYRILIKMGFRANITQTTGDGGIDIEAYYDGPIFSGKYLVQCKRWKNVVGEPIIRDFYGTLVAAKALKGIIITSSYFSKQAHEFASGKNMELIAQDELIKFINISDIQIEKGEYLSDFIYDIEFDLDNYTILKDRINNDPRNLRLHELIISQLLRAVIKSDVNAKINGLFNELEARLDTYRKVVNGKTSESKSRIYCAQWIKAMLCFIQGDLVQSYDLIKTIQSIQINKWELRRKEGFNSKLLLKTSTHDRFLYILFDLLQVEKAKEPILYRTSKEPGCHYAMDNLDNLDNGNIMQIYSIINDVNQHSQGIIATSEFLIGWPVGLEINSQKKHIIVDIIDISIGELLNRFLPDGIPDIDKQRRIIERSEVY
ncbi:MAG: restriction endonuclease [Clostridiaceae bacterium]|nr:restriction endonuclease [Clostridiaceae bacterium]